MGMTVGNYIKYLWLLVCISIILEHTNGVDNMSELKLGERTAGFIEGYAAALWDIELSLIRDKDGHCKTYDPMQVNIEDGTMHSYVFNMKDGGRHHQISQYSSIEDIRKTLLTETIQNISDEASFDSGMQFKPRVGRMVG